MDLYKAKAVEPSVDGSQRAQVLAERTENFYGKKQENGQHPRFPEKQRPGLAAQKLVCPQQRERAKQRAGGT